MAYLCVSAIYNVAGAGSRIEPNALSPEDVALFLDLGVLEPWPEPEPIAAPSPEPAPAPKRKARPKKSPPKKTRGKNRARVPRSG